MSIILLRSNTSLLPLLLPPLPSPSLGPGRQPGGAPCHSGGRARGDSPPGQTRCGPECSQQEEADAAARGREQGPCDGHQGAAQGGLPQQSPGEEGVATNCACVYVCVCVCV